MVHRRLSEESGGVTLGDIQGAVRRSGGRGNGARRVKVLRLSELVGERLRLVNRAGDGLVLVVEVLGLVSVTTQHNTTKSKQNNHGGGEGERRGRLVRGKK